MRHPSGRGPAPQEGQMGFEDVTVPLVPQRHAVVGDPESGEGAAC